jgi:hypothetical protein
MKPVFICDKISVYTETPEEEKQLQTSNSKLHSPSSKALWRTGRSFKLQAPKRGLDVGILVCLPAIAVLLQNQLPGWGFMWAMASAIYLSSKWITWRRAPRPMGWRRSIGYLFLWPGMDPEPFLSPALPGATNTGRWMRGGWNTATGAALMFVAARLAGHAQSLWVGWIGMLGVVFFLHFGVFELIAALWNKAGIRVKPVMQSPIGAMSLAEFWGRRWNTAFNDLAHALVFRPLVSVLTQASSPEPRPVVGRRLTGKGLLSPTLSSRGGEGDKLADLRRTGCKTPRQTSPLPSGETTRTRAVALATLAVFGISGLIHELVISVPARGGYGLPTAYFILQGLAVLFERSRLGKRIGLGRGVRGWLLTLACTAGPAFWLFHPPFVRNVILPMLRAFGGN